MNSQTLWPLALGLLLVSAGCAQEIQRTPASGSLGVAARSDQWQPHPKDQAILSGDVRRANFQAAASVKYLLRDACLEYYRMHQRLPATVEELDQLGFLPYTRLGASGEPLVWTTVGPEETPPIDKIGVRPGAEVFTLWVPRQDPNQPPFELPLTTTEILKTSKNFAAGSPLAPAPVEDIWAKLAPHAAELAGSYPHGGAQPRGGNDFLIRSDQPAEAQLRLADRGLRILIGTYVRRHGQLPTDLDAAWREIGFVPTTYKSEVSSQLPLPENLGFWAGVDKSGLVLKIVRKPTIDAVSTCYLEWTLDYANGGVKDVEVLTEYPSIPHEGFQPILQTIIESDVAPLHSSQPDAMATSKAAE